MSEDESKNPEEEGAKEEAAAPEVTEAKAESAPAAKSAKSAPAATEAAAAPAPAAEKKAEPEAPAEKKKKSGGAADILKALDPDGDADPRIVKAKASKKVHAGIVHVLATFNNTIVTVTDQKRECHWLVDLRKDGFPRLP